MGDSQGHGGQGNSGGSHTRANATPSSSPPWNVSHGGQGNSGSFDVANRNAQLEYEKAQELREKESARAASSTDPLERLFGGRIPGENRKMYLLRAGRSYDTLQKQNDWLDNVDMQEEATHDQLQDFISANQLLVYYDEIGVIDNKNKTTNKWKNRVTDGKNAMNQLRIRNAPVQKEKSRQFLHNRGIKGRTILSGQPTSQTNRPRVAQPQINSATTGTTLIRTG